VNRCEVVAELSDILGGVARGMESGRAADLLAGLCDRIRGAGAGPQLNLDMAEAPSQVATQAVAAQAVVPAKESSSEAVLRVFRHWQRATGKANARLLPGRTAKIRARLREFSEADLCMAIDGALLSDFHRGDNDGGTEYLDLRTLFKSGEVVEGHIERSGGQPYVPSLDDDPDAMRAAELKIAIAEAMRDGRTDDYNAHNTELRELLGR